MVNFRIPGPLNLDSLKIDHGTLARTQSTLPGVIKNDVQEKTDSICSNLKVNIPMSPVWEMIRASKGSKKNFDHMQKAIDYLTCKAKNKLVFSSNEREFLKEIFEALWWGGKAKGLPEAAELSNHYVNGGGERLKIESNLYESSVIVKDTMKAIEQYITAELKAKRKVVSVKSGDAAFAGKPYYKVLTKIYGSRNYKTEGYILETGALLTEQNNQRLKNADNRFYLQATVLNTLKSSMTVKYLVESTYDFEPFNKKNYYTNIPLAKGMVLKLPDGLSEHMVKLGIATVFDYYSEWNKTWSIKN